MSDFNIHEPDPLELAKEIEAGHHENDNGEYWFSAAEDALIVRALRALKARPEVRSHVPIKVRPMLVSGMLAKDERGPVILLDSEQSPEEQVRTFWHEVLHLVGLKDEVRAEETAMILAGACPTILRAVCDNINVPDSGLGMNSGAG